MTEGGRDAEFWERYWKSIDAATEEADRLDAPMLARQFEVWLAADIEAERALTATLAGRLRDAFANPVLLTGGSLDLEVTLRIHVDRERGIAQLFVDPPGLTWSELVIMDASGEEIAARRETWTSREGVPDLEVPLDRIVQNANISRWDRVRLLRDGITIVLMPA